MSLGSVESQYLVGSASPFGHSISSHSGGRGTHWYLGASPSRRSVQRIKDKVGAVLVPSNKGAWPEVRDQLNRLLRGWSNYFGYGTRLQAYRAVDNHVYDHVRHFLAQAAQGAGPRHADTSHANSCSGSLAFWRLRRVHLGPRRGPSRRSQSESRMREIRTSGSMSGNDGLGPFFRNRFADVVGIVSCIGDDDLGGRALEQCSSLRGIAFLASREDEAHGASQSTHC